MKRILAFFLLGLSLFASAGAQPADAPPARKVAVLSLIGDSLTVDVYRRRTGTQIDTNNKTAVPLATREFDHVALLSAESALNQVLPAGSSVVTLAVPPLDSDNDPARLLADGKPSAASPLIAALRKEGYTQLLVIAKHRAPARLQLKGETIGSGFVSGLGFYIDNDLPTRNIETNRTGLGFVAPYVFIKLVLVDLASLDIQGQQAITASTSRSAADNEDGANAWGAMSSEEKVSVLKRLTQQRVGAAVPELFRPK